MKNLYITALTDLILAGTSVDESLSRVRSYMEARGHQKLWPTVLTAVLRELTVTLRQQQPHLTIAKSADANAAEVKTALAELGATTESLVTVDPNLIGGYIAEYAHQRKNASYKHQLVALYREIVRP